jgi:hypothetical protein
MLIFSWELWLEVALSVERSIIIDVDLQLRAVAGTGADPAYCVGVS